MNETKTYICTQPERLDLFLSHKIEQTRSQIAGLIKMGYVYVEDKKTQKPGIKLKAEQVVRVEFPALSSSATLTTTNDSS
jgi:23S rRNA pseudouridine1911/1915/1917 synthase